MGKDIRIAASEAITKPTPIDADRIVLYDSAAAWGFKALTWANIKLALKKYLNVYNYYVGTDVDSVLDELGETRAINGYDKTQPDTEPELTFDNATRTFNASVKAGQSSFHFWVDSKKIVKTTTHSAILPDVTATYYIIFDDTEELVVVNKDVITLAAFYNHAITGLVYWNATTQLAMVGDERHGLLMDARTHHYEHSTYGARYEQPGLNINGLIDRSKTYTETTSGHFWDEDIRHTVSLQSTHPFLYKLGSTGEWNGTTPDNNVGFKNGTSNVVFNEFTGTTWQLTESGSSTDYIIYFFIVTPDIGGYPVKKIIGQNGYKDRNAARNAIDTEISKLTTEGLPSPEFVFLYAYIVRQNGDLEDLEDNSTYIDLRISRGGSGGNSATTTVAGDINVNTIEFNNVLSPIDTTTQKALETLDDHTHLTRTTTRILVPTTTTTIPVTQLKNTLLSNYSQAVETTHILGDCEDGLEFRFQIDHIGVGDVHLKAGPNDKIYLNKVPLGVGDKVTCVDPTLGDSICFRVLKTGTDTYDWLAFTDEVNWVDGGV